MQLALLAEIYMGNSQCNTRWFNKSQATVKKNDQINQSLEPGIIDDLESTMSKKT